jgi:hypothetical protein
MKIDCSFCKFSKRKNCEVKASPTLKSGKLRKNKLFKMEILNKDSNCPLFIRKLYDN